MPLNFVHDGVELSEDPRVRREGVSPELLWRIETMFDPRGRRLEKPDLKDSTCYLTAEAKEKLQNQKKEIDAQVLATR